MRQLLRITTALAIGALLLGPGAVSQAEESSQRNFTVSIIEAKFSQQGDISKVAPETIWKTTRDSSKTDWAETIRCTVLDGQQASVMFGKSVSVVTGVSESQRGRTRSTRDMQIGTAVKLTAESHEDRVAVQVEYQSSRLSGVISDEPPPPSVEQNEIASTLVLEIGKPKILSATPGSVVLIMVEESSN